MALSAEQMDPAAFEGAVNFVLAREGGYSNDPKDPGGETRLGITFGTLQRAISAGILPDGTTVRDLTREQALKVYRVMYWDAAGCRELPGPLAIALFDAVVNMGQGIGTQLLQNALGVTSDGVIGETTARAAWAAQARGALQATVRDYLKRRLVYYASRQHWSTYRNGWTDRVLLLHEFILTGRA